MNDTPQCTTQQEKPVPAFTGWTRTLAQILICLLFYLAVVGTNYLCLTRHVYDQRTSRFVFAVLGLITFVMAAFALFKPQSK